VFKIGEFSKLSLVPAKTLRYYDQIGLLKPNEVDHFTGYRYYSASQLPRLNRILALKDLGLSLEEIGRLLDEELTAAQIRGTLRLRRVEIQERLSEEEARLARVEWRLRCMEQEETMSGPEVVIKSVPAMRVASLRKTIPSMQAIGSLFGEAFGFLGQHRVAPVGPPVAIYYDQEFRETDADVEVAIPVAQPLPKSGTMVARELSAVETMACAVHQGSYETIGASYGQVMAWIEANGYRMCGPVREVYIQGPESGQDPSAYVTEIQVPVEKA